MSFEEGDTHAWSEIFADSELKKRLVDMDNEVLDLTLKEVSSLLEGQYKDNKEIGLPFAALVMRGFNIHDAKRMVLQVLLIEDPEDSE
ncbi:MAG: hypothetical protein IJF83_05745 [Methanobrevibacter sp.]|nr:hypothetical protein [Methanobrevibacter sp.]